MIEKKGNALGSNEKEAVEAAFVDNMKAMYIRSSMGFDLESKREEWFDPAAVFLMDYDGDELAAYLIYKVEPEVIDSDSDSGSEDADESPLCVYIYELQVQKRYQGQKKGTALVNEAAARARALGLAKCMLTVLLSNQSALKFYAAMAFDTDESSPDDEDYTILSKCVV